MPLFFSARIGWLGTSPARLGRGWRHGRALAVASRRSGSGHRVSRSSREFMRSSGATWWALLGSRLGLAVNLPRMLAGRAPSHDLIGAQFHGLEIVVPAAFR